MIPKPVEDIGEGDILGLIGEQETITLEFKREMWKKGEEFAKDISAAANGQGADFVVGANVKLGSGALLKLVNDTFKDLFNNHTHPYQNGTPVYGWAVPPSPTGETDPPSSTLEDSHLTEQTIAS